MVNPRGGGLSEDGLEPLRDVIARHDLGAKKALGQHFLLDLNLTRRIARSAKPFENVVEIGPGPGGLTRALLLEGAHHVLAIEKDQRCLNALAEIAALRPTRLTVLEGDALSVDPRAEFVGRPGGIDIVANLPYNISVELLVGWLRGDGAAWPSWWGRLTLMFQREVAERIVAQPRSKVYGRLSVLAQWRASAKLLFDVRPQAFTPPPAVTSSIVQLTPTDPIASCDLPALERVTAAAFNQRRKMLRGSLKALDVDAKDLLSKAEVAEDLRADATTVRQYCALARSYRSLRDD